MAASDYTGKEKTSLNNIKEMIVNATSLEEIRGNMGLGRSLGVLAVANGGTGQSSESGVYKEFVKDHFSANDAFLKYMNGESGTGVADDGVVSNSMIKYVFDSMGIGESYAASGQTSAYASLGNKDSREFNYSFDPKIVVPINGKYLIVASGSFSTAAVEPGKVNLGINAGGSNHLFLQKSGAKSGDGSGLFAVDLTANSEVKGYIYFKNGTYGYVGYEATVSCTVIRI